VNQEDRNLGAGDRNFGRDLFEIQFVFQASVEKGELDNRTKNRAAEPGAGVEALAHAVVADLAEAGEGRLGYGGQKRVSVRRDCRSWAAPIDSPRPKMHIG